MQLSRSKHASAGFFTSMLFLTLAAANTGLDCSLVVAGGVHWDLSQLGGPRSVMHSESTPPTLRNTTYTIDICGPLIPAKSVEKGNKCKSGTRGRF
jgi:hypothetical protein